jgi:Ca2+-binding EF-hand superfamily protein
LLKSISIAIAATASVLPSTAVAQQGASRPVARGDVVKTLDASFAAADTNHDGFLSKSEIDAAQAKALQQIQELRQRQLRTDFNRLDTNHDGQLSFQEFAAAVGPIKATETGAQFIGRLDKNHDGKISAEEYRAPNLKKFDAADTNHDGIVTPAEAQAYNKAHPATPPSR